MRRNRLAVACIILGLVLLALGGVAVYVYSTGHGRTGRGATIASLPSDLLPQPSPATIPAAAAVPSQSPIATTKPTPVRPSPTVVPSRPGIPTGVILPDGLTYRIGGNPPNADGSLFVYRDPKHISWASEYAAPGSSSGTQIFISHINYSGVNGAFWNLSDYHVGQRVTLLLQDGRRLTYVEAAAPIEVNKEALAADLNVAGEPLHQKLFGQSKSLKPRMLFMSCGGIFDYSTGNYESNFFVFFRPV